MRWICQLVLVSIILMVLFTDSWGQDWKKLKGQEAVQKTEVITQIRQMESQLQRIKMMLGLIQEEDTEKRESKELEARSGEQKAWDQEAQQQIRQMEARLRAIEAKVASTQGRDSKNGVLNHGRPSAQILNINQEEGPSEAEDQSEWEEPEVELKPQLGRDEEARRRVLELETWRRKMEAEKAISEEEEEKKVKFNFSGKYKGRVNMRDNLNLDNDFQRWRFDDETYFDQRYQLQVEALYGPLSALLLLDKGNFTFDWKEDSEGTLERWAEFFTVNSALVRQLYVQYTGPFVARFGRINWMIGHSIVLEGPVDSLQITYPMGYTPLGNLSITGGYIAISGGWRDYTDFLKIGPPAGSREAVFSATNKLDGYYLGLDLRPSPSLRIEPYILKVFDRGKFGEADLNLDKDFNFSTTPRDGGFEPLWTAISLSGKMGPLSYDAEGILLTGSYTRDRDLRAYAFLLGGEYDFEETHLLGKLLAGLEFGLGSGNDAEDSETTGKVKDFNSLFLCRDRHKFGNIFSEDLRAGFFLWDSSLANVTYLRGHVTANPFKDLDITLALSRIWSTEDVFEGHGPVLDWSRGLNLSTRKTNDVGWEIDLNINFPIIQKLRGFLNFGYFLPGDAYRRPDGRDADPAMELVFGSEFVF